MAQKESNCDVVIKRNRLIPWEGPVIGWGLPIGQGGSFRVIPREELS